MLSAILIMALGAVVLGAALGYASIKFKVEGNPLVEKIEAILPQTQCGQCGFPGCKPYAEAIAEGEVDINLCPPGGQEGVRKLADLLGREVKPLNAEEKPKQVAIIDEQTCIGCTLCIQACPVDAIVGAAKQMHTIVAEQCTGCELCVPPCPVDCIAMLDVSGQRTGWDAWSQAEADTARARYAFHQFRVQREQEDNAARLQAKAEAKLADLAAHSLHTDPQVLDQKRTVIEAALQRARARRAGPV